MRIGERAEFEDASAAAGEPSRRESNAPAPLTIGWRVLVLIVGLWTLFGLLQAAGGIHDETSHRRLL